MRVKRYSPTDDATVRQFCFPYGGGGVSIFRGWAEHLPSFVDLCSVELPGRDSLVGEPPLTDLSELINRLHDVVTPWLDRPFAFFGHSLGALVGFELTRFLRRLGGALPHILVVSGHAAPHVMNDRKSIHQLPQEEFVSELRRLAGTPPSVLQNSELMELLLPALRADFGLNDTYAYEPEAPLQVPIVAFGGIDDEEVNPENIAAWREHCVNDFRVYMFKGGHFFLNSARLEVLAALSDILTESVKRCSREVGHWVDL